MVSISTVIVTYNGSAWIAKCIQSLLDSSIETSIIVVDNASSDDTVKIIQNHFNDKVVLIQSETNLGFGQGNNLGIKKALELGADFLFLLNQDAWVKENTIAELLLHLKSHNSNGIVSPIHFNGSGKVLDANFFRYFMKSQVEGYITSTFSNTNNTSSFIDTKFVNAAAWLINKSCLIRVGGFDKYFFHYGEDRNFAQRAIFFGYRIGIITSAHICHDRHLRPNYKRNTSQQVEFDFMNFKIDACNIRRKNIHFFILKRSLRYFLIALIYLISLRLNKFFYSCRMFWNVTFSFRRVMLCRKRSLKGRFELY